MPEPTIITKTSIMITVLHRTDADLAAMTLEDILEESNTGNFVASYSSMFQKPIPAEEVSAELLALGNDGTFFDDDLEGDDDE